MENSNIQIKIGKYKHYKGKLYQVLGLARHSETLEELIVYQALYESKEFGNHAIWVRPVKMFTENVVFEGKSVKRFTFISN